MPPKKKPIDPEVAGVIWAAGVISSGGSLSLVTAGNTKVVRYVITSSMFPGAMEKLSEVLGASITKPTMSSVKPSSRITLQGAALHASMTRVWEYLTNERKRQYADFRKGITTTTEGPNPYKDQDIES